jgi:phage terminase Nu1 subunit (DNA packaging protein)
MAKPKAEIAGRILNKNEMSGVLGVAAQTLQRWVGAGCPCLDEGSPGRGARFNELAVKRWVEERRGLKSSSSQDDEAKRRYNEANAQLKELRLAQLRGDLVPLADVRAVWESECVTIRQRLLALSDQLAPQLAHISDVREIARLIDHEIRQALVELSGGDEDAE